MIRLDAFHEIVARLRTLGWADGDIGWSGSIKPPTDPAGFALEIAFVILNSGMRNSVAEEIWRGREARGDLPALVGLQTLLLTGHSAGDEFGHAGKVAAIDRIWRDRVALLADYQTQQDDGARLAWLEKLPWIGGITKYHAAKNFGVQCAKPDVHLQRLADLHRTTPQELCADLARKTGHPIPTIDTLLWRACAYGVVDSNTCRLLPVEAGVAA